MAKRDKYVLPCNKNYVDATDDILIKTRNEILDSISEEIDSIFLNLSRPQSIDPISGEIKNISIATPIEALFGATVYKLLIPHIVDGCAFVFPYDDWGIKYYSLNPFGIIIDSRQYGWSNHLPGNLLITMQPQKQFKVDGHTYYADYFFHCAVCSQERTSVFNSERGELTLADIIVELDGHDFHEKTKEQAKKDKERDRNLMKVGNLVIHFTGSEVYNDPVKTVHSTFEYIISVSIKEMERQTKLVSKPKNEVIMKGEEG